MLEHTVPDGFSKFHRKPSFPTPQSWPFCLKMAVFNDVLKTNETYSLRVALKKCGMGSSNTVQNRVSQFQVLQVASSAFLHENGAKKSKIGEECYVFASTTKTVRDTSKRTKFQPFRVIFLSVYPQKKSSLSCSKIDFTTF